MLNLENIKINKKKILDSPLFFRKTPVKKSTIKIKGKIVKTKANIKLPVDPLYWSSEEDIFFRVRVLKLAPPLSCGCQEVLSAKGSLNTEESKGSGLRLSLILLIKLLNPIVILFL